MIMIRRRTESITFHFACIGGYSWMSYLLAGKLEPLQFFDFLRGFFQTPVSTFSFIFY
jgi:hypothetical protein